MIPDHNSSHSPTGMAKSGAGPAGDVAGTEIADGGRLVSTRFRLLKGEVYTCFAILWCLHYTARSGASIRHINWLDSLHLVLIAGMRGGSDKLHGFQLCLH